MVRAYCNNLGSQEAEEKLRLAVNYPHGMECGNLLGESDLGYYVMLYSGGNDLTRRDATFFQGEECFFNYDGRLVLVTIKYFDPGKGVLVEWEGGGLSWESIRSLSK
jgi:hypothetical protein